MAFNIDKCGVMHFGPKNIKHEYSLGNKVLKSVVEERDLGILISYDMKFEKHCCKAANDANRTLGIIKRNFTCRSEGFMTALYKSLIRPKLDYCIQAWRPYYEKDILNLEQLQRRVTKLVDGLHQKSYSERLVILGLTTFRTRMLRADLIEVFKIFKGLDNLEPSLFFKIRSTGRGHELKLYKERFRLEIGRNRFANRICDEWNHLHGDIISASSLNMFKDRLDHQLNSGRFGV